MQLILFSFRLLPPGQLTEIRVTCFLSLVFSINFLQSSVRLFSTKFPFHSQSGKRGRRDEKNCRESEQGDRMDGAAVFSVLVILSHALTLYAIAFRLLSSATRMEFREHHTV